MQIENETDLAVEYRKEERKESLSELKQINPQTVNRADLMDIRDAVVKEDLPKKEKMKDFISQIGNPYLCRCGNIVVQSVFSDTEITLTERLKQYFQMV